MVCRIKDLLWKTKDLFLSLLAYRNVPGKSGYSLAQLLMGHSLQTRVPVPWTKLAPDWLHIANFKVRDTAKMHHQSLDFNRCHAAYDLRTLEKSVGSRCQDKSH